MPGLCVCVCVFVCINAACVCVRVCVLVLVSYHEQLQQQHQQKQQALGRWEFCVVVMPRPPAVSLSAEVSLRPPPMASSPPRSAGIGPVYCKDTGRERHVLIATGIYSDGRSAVL